MTPTTDVIKGLMDMLCNALEDSPVEDPRAYLTEFMTDMQAEIDLMDSQYPAEQRALIVEAFDVDSWEEFTRRTQDRHDAVKFVLSL